MNQPRRPRTNKPPSVAPTAMPAAAPALRPPLLEELLLVEPAPEANVVLVGAAEDEADVGVLDEAVVVVCEEIDEEVVVAEAEKVPISDAVRYASM